MCDVIGLSRSLANGAVFGFGFGFGLELVVIAPDDAMIV